MDVRTGIFHLGRGLGGRGMETGMVIGRQEAGIGNLRTVAVMDIGGRHGVTRATAQTTPITAAEGLMAMGDTEMGGTEEVAVTIN